MDRDHVVQLARGGGHAAKTYAVANAIVRCILCSLFYFDPCFWHRTFAACVVMATWEVKKSLLWAFLG